MRSRTILTVPVVRRLLFLAGLALVALASPATASAATPLYPDLKTLPPRDLKLERTDQETPGSAHNVLRFSNTAWNVGRGALAIRGDIDPATKSGPAYQRIYNDDGSFTERPVGGFYWHAQHSHYHFENWGRYELWTRAEYDRWRAGGSGDPLATDVAMTEPRRLGSKTTSCVMDEEFVKTLPGTPFPAAYPSGGCFSGADGDLLQGLSPGWGDTYDFWRFEQWVDLGQESLADGDYVLRSVADPDNRMHESADKSDAVRESADDNEGVTPFRISGGKLVDMSAPSGTVTVNDVDPDTTSSQVKLKLLGRDDVLFQPGDRENIDQVKVSNDGVSWKTYPYTGANSTPMRVDWDLADASYGGSVTAGTKTVYAQFHDRKGNWSATETDTIELTSGTPPSAKPDSGYAAAVRGDGPAAWWRVGERSGTLADSEFGAYDGAYVNGVSLGLQSLLAGDRDNDSILLDSNKYMRVPHADALSFGTSLSLETWIKPTEIPAAGGWASILTKQNAYSLQFNGPRLELTVVQGAGMRKRLQAPAGAIVPGRAYHVVGTYDGAQQRLYIDGKEVASGSLSGPANATGHSLLVGSWDGTSEFFHGKVDEPAVYASALSPARVQAHFDAGSTEAPPPPDVAAPTELKATASSSSQIDLRWTDKASNETGYVVERSADASFTSPTRVTLAPNTASYADTGLPASTTYHYRIKAVKDAKSSDWSSTESATTASPPRVAPPTGLSAKAVSASKVDLAWTDNATDETGHVLERSTDTGFTSPTVVNLLADARSYSDTNASPSTAYHYRVKAVRGGTSSTWSNAANVTTPSPPTAAYAPTVLGDGPVGYWRLGERSGISAADEKKAVTGTYLGGPVLGAPSLLASDPSNTAARFDGVDDSVRFPTAASFNLTSRMTLEAWIQPRAIPPAGRWASLVAKAESYSLQFNGPRLEFTIVQSGVRQRLQAAAGAVVAGRKYHVVGTFDGTTRRLFINGTQVASARLAGGASTTPRVLRIGTWDGTGGEMLNGTVDDVAVYGKALAPDRVVSHFNVGAGPGATPLQSGAKGGAAVSDRRIEGGDTTRPAVTAVSPVPAAAGISTGANVIAAFSEPMRASTVTNTTVRLLRRGATSAGAATVTYDPAKKRAKLDPKNALAPGATYTAKVTTGTKDRAGNPLARAKSWSFKTRK